MISVTRLHILVHLSYKHSTDFVAHDIFFIFTSHTTLRQLKLGENVFAGQSCLTVLAILHGSALYDNMRTKDNKRQVKSVIPVK